MSDNVPANDESLPAPHIEGGSSSRLSEEGQPLATPAQAHQAQAQADGAYILLVDDDPDAQEIMSAMLEIAGWNSKKAPNGAEALDMAAATPPALVLLDLMMPGMNGFEVLNRLKANPRTRAIPVVIFSAMGNDQRLTRLGASRVIEKGDVSIDRLRQIIDECLSGVP